MNLTTEQLEELRILRRNFVVYTSRIRAGYSLTQSISSVRRQIARILAQRSRPQ